MEPIVYEFKRLAKLQESMCIVTTTWEMLLSGLTLFGLVEAPVTGQRKGIDTRIDAVP